MKWNHTLSLLGLVLLSAGLSSISWAQERAALEDRYLAALKLRGAEQHEQAIEEFQSMIAVHPDFGKAYKSLVEAFIFSEDVSGAQDYFEGLLSENPQNPYAHYGLARVALKQENLDEAITHLERSIALDPGFVFAYGHDGGIADAYLTKSDVDGAVPFFQGLVARDPSNANAYYGLGCSFNDRYDWGRALEAFEEALRLNPELTQVFRERIRVYGTTGRYRDVLDASDKLLSLASRRKEPSMVAYAKFAQATAYFYLGDYWKALDYSNEALRIFEEIGAKERVGVAYNNLANIYGLVGDQRKARELYIASLDLARRVGDRVGEVNALNNTGNSYYEQGELKTALSYLEEALELATRRGMRHDEAYALINLAAVYSDFGETGRAFVALHEALSISRDVGDNSLTGSILADLGNLYQEQGDLEKAAEYLQEALELGNEFEDVEVIWRARARLGLLLEQEGDLEGAMSHFAETISLYDAARGKLGVESMGVDFLQSQDLVFPSMIRLLAETGRYEEAFRYAEKFKATSLLALLSQGESVIKELLPKSVSSKLEGVSVQLEAVHAALSQERAKESGSRERIFALERRVTDLELQQESLIDEVKREHPSYYQLTTSELVDIDEVRSRYLGSNQTLIEYIVGEETLSIFVLTQEELAYRAVSVSRKELEQMLAELSPVFKKDKPLDEASRQLIFNPQLADFSVPPARALYDVLIEPVEPWLGEGTELVIVPDDVLFYLPFEILIHDASDIENRYDFANARFLLESYPISYAASASLLDPELQRPKGPSRGVLAFGNPDFERREQDRLSADYLSSMMVYSGGVVRGGELLPLPNAESEVSAIGRAVADSRIHVGSRASERAFKEEASEYRVLHLATHFLSDDRQPLYSKIALAQEDDAQEDGYLQTFEIFNTRLNADLVVLSACNTGLGKLSKGEGLVGISRAFFYAGVPSLVVSLWSVDDEATSDLMKSFYQHLAAGTNKKQALRLAKLDYLVTARNDKRDPFFWAPFILIGDWSPVPGLQGNRRDMAVWIIAAVALLVFVWLAASSRRRSSRPA